MRIPVFSVSEQTGLEQTKLSHIMRKPTICIRENKDADQLLGNREADQCLCFRYTDSTITLLSKSKISSFWQLMCLYSSVCVEPVQKPHCLFSHEVAQLLIDIKKVSIQSVCFVWSLSHFS